MEKAQLILAGITGLAVIGGVLDHARQHYGSTIHRSKIVRRR